MTTTQRLRDLADEALEKGVEPTTVIGVLSAAMNSFATCTVAASMAEVWLRELCGYCSNTEEKSFAPSKAKTYVRSEDEYDGWWFDGDYYGF
jgi:hypothetical protein